MNKLDVQSAGQWREYVLAFLASTLSATILLKIGEIQYLELIFAADFLILLCLFAGNGLRVAVFKPFLSLGRSYAIFLALALLLSVVALQQNFYSAQYSFFKRPLIVTLSRMAELFLDVLYMLYLASLYRQNERLCRFAAKVYYFVGVAGGIYAVVTFPLNYLFEMQLGTYTVSHRMRGFNNEAGSYGTYLVSVILLTVAMHHRGWLTRRQFYGGMALFLFCFAASQSKGGFFVLVVIAIFHTMWTQTGWRRWATLAGAGICFAVVAWAVNIPRQLETYAHDSAVYREVSNLRSDDGNFVAGRIAGAVIAPRMMAAHPWRGIGWGNYPLVRDDPEYRQGTAFSMLSFDSPSLGPIDYMVDLGFPLWFYMTWIALKPVYLLRRRGADPWLLSLAMMQPVSNWFGAHLNVTYPWVVVGLALGMGYSKSLGRQPESEA